MNLQREIYENYAVSVGLDPSAKYFHGTPLRPVVPLDTGTGGIFILGAYPSSRFALINGLSNVPIADNLGPFEPERWFDGASVREQPSERELYKLFLKPLGLLRSSCWITDLVKVFLFKSGHVTRYRQLDAEPPAGYVRERFFELGKRSMQWIERELHAAQPRLLITLGAEVAGVLHDVSSPAAQVQLLVPRVQPMRIGAIEVKTIHCAHPGILMRPAPNNPWPTAHENEFVPAMKNFLAPLLDAAAPDLASVAT